MGKKIWTDEYINLLKEHYSDNGAEYCTQYINLTKQQIMVKASALKLKVNEDVKHENCVHAQIKYQINRTDDDLMVGVNQFLNITSKNVAYFLGIFWADGYLLTSRNELRFEILTSDMDTIKSTFNKIGKWSYQYRTRVGSRNYKPTTRVVTKNRKLCDFLKKNDYHIKSGNSADKILSKIPDNLKNYFFRGLVDGDGCFDSSRGVGRLSISSCYNQDWSFVSELDKTLKVNSRIYQNENTTGRNSSITYNFGDTILFGDYIYQDYDFIGFPRKHNKFIKITDIYNSSKKYKMKQQYLIVSNLTKNGLTPLEIIKETNIPPTTVRRWVKSFIKTI